MNLEALLTTLIAIVSVFSVVAFVSLILIGVAVSNLAYWVRSIRAAAIGISFAQRSLAAQSPGEPEVGDVAVSESSAASGCRST